MLCAMPVRSSRAPTGGAIPRRWAVPPGQPPRRASGDPLPPRAPRLRDGGYMLGLADPGLDAAERMGVADALRAARHMPRRLVYVDGGGRERFTLGGAALDRLVGERRFNLLR